MPAVTRMQPAHLQIGSAETLAKARVAQAVKREARKQSTLRRDFLDDDAWLALARAKGVRLPVYGEPCSPTGMRKFLTKLGISVSAYYAWSADKNLAEFASRNASWPLRAWAGTVLEWVGGRVQGTSM